MLQTEMTNREAAELDYFWAALMFYTRIPVPDNALHSQEVLNKSRKYFPLIGVIVGSVAVCIYLSASQVFGTELSIALSMLSTVLITGAFHEDGFADSCDGFGGGWTHDQVLTIMKDSRVGTYATVGLIFLFGIKFLTLVEISSLENILLFCTVYIAAHTLSRAISSSMIDLFDYVQDIDQSKIKPITELNLQPSDKLFGLVTTILPILFLASFSLAMTIVACLAACVVAIGFMAYSRHRIGGYTGDVLGAIQQLSELAFYLSIAACI